MRSSAGQRPQVGGEPGAGVAGFAWQIAAGTVQTPPTEEREAQAAHRQATARTRAARFMGEILLLLRL
jgi:hypothetical protein